jgi:hypothetical protein
MTPTSPGRLRQTAHRARSIAGRIRTAPVLEVEVAALRERIHELELNANHLEKRLHVAEYTVRQFEEVGLSSGEAADPGAISRWLTWRPPGHFYSPIPNLRELEKQADTLWPVEPPTELPGVDLRADEQLATFSRAAKLARSHEIHQRSTDPWRYYSDNVAYGVGDALMLHGMLRLIRPQRLIEIGSGHSSAMMLDTVEHYVGGKTELTFIEPYPELLESLLRNGDRERITIVPTGLQQVPLDTFRALESGDVLFIDSTHVLKTGSDVAWLYANVLPSIKPGVWVHIHDMFYPFEYPKAWVMEGRAWSEVYLVRAFLAFNSDFEIVLFNDWVAKFHRDRIEAELPAMLGNTGGALWLRRTPTSDRGR